MGALLGKDVVYAEPGDLVFKPRNQWHTFWNAGDTPCRLLEIISPAGFEHFFNELGEQMAEAKAVSVAEVANLPELGARYGHYFQPESIARLCQEHGLVYPGVGRSGGRADRAVGRSGGRAVGRSGGRAVGRSGGRAVQTLIK